MNALEKMLENVWVAAVICWQWGDTGKGKFIDILAAWADIIFRGTGGSNAGHTIEVNDKTVIVHLVPSGVVRPDKINIIGSGVVIDPRELVGEIATLGQNGIDCEGRLFIAHNAKLVLPHHLVIDRIRNLVKSKGKGRIGTTGRGIGPTYSQFYDRSALFVNDLQNPDVFARGLEESLSESVALLKGYDKPEAFEEIMRHKDLGGGAFYSPTKMFDQDAIIEAYLKAGKQLQSMITDTDTMLREALGRKKILGEGAQGVLLSIYDGTYPFVTSSDCSSHGLAKGGGLRHRDIDKTFSIVKAFCMTRVGEGPFPTEMGGEQSDEWCEGGEAAKRAKELGCKSVREFEGNMFDFIGPDSPNEFLLGILARKLGREYGATTQRPRRTGWLDLPLVRYSQTVTGDTETVLTKLDVLGTFPVIKVCTGYLYDGPDYKIGNRTLVRGDNLEVAIPRADVLKHCRPIYREFPGWLCDIQGCTSVQDLPRELTTIIDFVEKQTGTHWQMLSVGPNREQTIFRQ